MQKKRKRNKYVKVTHTQAEFTSIALTSWSLTIFILPLILRGTQAPLGGFWSSEDLGVFRFHLETAKGQTAETLRLTWTALDATCPTTLLLKGCKISLENVVRLKHIYSSLQICNVIKRHYKLLPCSCFFNSSIWASCCLLVSLNAAFSASNCRIHMFHHWISS